MAKARIDIRNVTKHFRTKQGDVHALDDVSLEVAESEMVVLLGPSGCGKTTLLRCIAGLERPDQGEIEVHGEVMFSTSRRVFRPPERRRISMVFQSYALWPHLTVFDNVAYPLRNRRMRGAGLEKRVSEVLAMVGCGHLGKRHPGQLSGGQQQRVALARAIVSNDGVILFDEPLSNVDAKVRDQLRVELLAMQQELGFSAVYVTHDQTEATVLGHRIAVMNAGTIAQVASPRVIYEKPASRYVADFIGTANTIDGVVDSAIGTLIVRTPLGPLVSNDLAHKKTDRVVVVFRPERCRLSRHLTPGSANQLPCVVESVLFLGFHTEYVLKVGDQRIRARSAEGVWGQGDEGWLSVEPDNLLVFRA